MDELTKRNFNSLSEGLKAMRADNELLREDLKNAQTTVAQNIKDIGLLRQQMYVMMAKVNGHGATS